MTNFNNLGTCTAFDASCYALDVKDYVITFVNAQLATWPLQVGKVPAMGVAVGAEVRLAVSEADRPDRESRAANESNRGARVRSPRRNAPKQRLKTHLNGGEQGSERVRYPVEVDRLDQQAGVAQLALRARTKETSQLRRLVLVPPGGLSLDGAERNRRGGARRRPPAWIHS
ncbi:MAG: hypothetical protein ABSA02_32385 [Trebonia sp.]